MYWTKGISGYSQYHDADYAAMRTIADADETECKKLDLLTPLSEEVKHMEKGA